MDESLLQQFVNLLLTLLELFGRHLVYRSVYRELLIFEFNAELVPLPYWGYTSQEVMLEHLLVFL